MDCKCFITKIAYHRNGVSGAGFYVLLFNWEDRHMIANVFDGDGEIAVLDRDQIASGDIEFGVGSFRGDHYEADLRKAIAQYEEHLNICPDRI